MVATIRFVLVGGLLVWLLGACGGEQAERSQEAVTEGAEAVPAGQVALLDGGRLALDELDGRWLFVNYWAEWCAPCLVEIPELNQFQAEAKDRVVVLGINFDGLPPEVMAPQVERLDIRFPVAVNDADADPGELLGIELPEVLPSTYVFDPDGRQVGVLLGPQTLEQLYAAMEDSSQSQ